MIIFPQNYVIHKHILGKILFNFDKQNSTLSVNIYKSTETSLPPIEINNDINIYDSIKQVDWLNKKPYISINNNDYSISQLRRFS